MSIQVDIGAPTLVCAPPVNEQTQKWGVYAIPRMWRDAAGKLMIRLNGEEDSADVRTMFRVPDLWFSSEDEGKSWLPAEPSDIRVLQGITPPFLKLKSGDTIAVREAVGNRPIHEARHRNEFLNPCGDARLRTYYWRDIPEDCRRLELVRYRKGENSCTAVPISLNFGEREVMVNAFARTENGDYTKVEETLKPFIFKNPYLSALTELPDGTIGALCCGQSPLVKERYCPDVYLVVSEDGGATWKKRSTVAGVSNEWEKIAFPYGFGGDGNEVSLTMTDDGELLCVMRMDLSLPAEKSPPFWGTMLARSRDFGYSWEKPVPVSEQSVTPHVIALQSGVTAVIYGRPGVHMIVSEDNMRTFSPPISLIGQTIWDERRAGRSDNMSKYGDTVSYSNTFAEVISDDSFLVLYNDLKYAGSDGLYHKAAFTRRITLNKT